MRSRRVIAIVTAFHPSLELISNTGRIRSQVDDVIVVDDGSGPDFESVLTEVELSGSRVIRSAENSGIAAALNAGVDLAAAGEDDLVVTFDQDSIIPDGFVAALVSRWDDAVSAGVRVGMVSPERFAGESQSMGPGRDVAREPIQSGSLYSGSVLALAGRFRDDLFIDLVDVEYYLRLRSLGLETLAVPGLDLPHELGRSYPIAVFGIPMRVKGRALTTSLSTPFRYFYRARNRLVIDSVYGTAERQLLQRDHLMELRHLLFVLAYSRPRLRMLRLLRDGRRAGRALRMGKMPEASEKLAATISWRLDPIER